MVRVDIKITTTKGFNTALLLAGSAPHTPERVETSPTQASYYESLVIGGKTVHLRFQTNPGPTKALGFSPDLEGDFSYWKVTKIGNPSTALGRVEFHDDAGNPYSLLLGSFGSTDIHVLKARLEGEGETAEFHLRGNKGNDTLLGGSGDDELNGREGADSMIGMSGDDAYRVDNKNDKVIENSEGANPGRDTIFTTINYTLPGNVEIISANGSHGLALTGNSLGNTISGNTGNDTLKGMGGQ